MNKVLVVRADEYKQLLGEHAFIGLPREEVERLYGGLEVHAMERAVVERDDELLALVTLTALHYNYSWLSIEGRPRSLGIVGELLAEGEPPLFLDESLGQVAQRSLASFIEPPDAAQWRLAGLIRARRLALVYVARLRQPGVVPREGSRVRFSGHLELRAARAEFDHFSQLLIDNQAAM